jgi:hypothetical protein
MIVTAKVACYEKQVSRASATHAVSSSGTGGWRELFITLGLSTTIAGLFALGGALIEGRQKGHDERCKIAREIVGDEMPNPALSREAHGRLGLLAAVRVRECLGERK